MDFERYNFTLDCDHPEWLTDKRHIEVIYEFIMANDFNRVAEIGSYSGASTAAFIEALNQGKDFNLHIAEINPTRQLRALISTCKKPDNIILHVQSGEEVLEQEIHIDKPDISHNPADCDIFEDPNSVACLGPAKGYEPTNHVERLVQKGATYATRFVPMMNSGAKGSDYADVLKK